jgi:hypothetical protein
VNAVDGDLASDQKYLRAALYNQYNVILALGAVAFAVAFASWGPVIAGLLGEAVWLFVAPRLPSFRRSVDRSVARAGNAKAIEALAPEYAQRLVVVEQDVREIESLCASRADLSAEQRLEVSRRLQPVVQTFLTVCDTHQRLRRVTSTAPLGELQAEVSSLHQSLSTETDLGVRASLRRALNVADRRIKQLESNEAAARSLELALSTMQKSLAMLKEGAAGLSTGPELCAEVDAAATQLTRAATLDVERDIELSSGGGRTSALPPALS